MGPAWKFPQPTLRPSLRQKSKGRCLRIFKQVSQVIQMHLTKALYDVKLGAEWSGARKGISIMALPVA